MSQPMVCGDHQQQLNGGAAAAAAAATTATTTATTPTITVATREGNIMVDKNADYHDALMNHYDPTHPRSSKRRCSYNNGNNSNNGTMEEDHAVPPVTSTTTNSRDCYEEVTAEACTNQQLLRHDWFYEIPCLSRHNPRPFQDTQSATTSTTLQAVQSECQSLDHQLQQVKRRFQVASERCAQAVLQANTFETDEHCEFEQARRACNPYEALGETCPGGLNHGLFLNRSAIKIANMDAVLDFTLTATNATSSATTTATSNANHNKSGPVTFHFADLCAAPGGFSEYILRRFCHSLSNGTRQEGCRGYGMSLVGDNDQGHGTPWKLSQGPLLLGNGNAGGVYYHICNGEDGTGDVFQWRNIQSLHREICAAQRCPAGERVNGCRVALVVADGGVDAQRNVEHPEAMTQKLVVCQVAAAMSLLQSGGRLILKLLGCQTTSGVLQCVMQYLYDSFDSLQVLKPISSRPASAERYLVCTGFRGVGLQQQQLQPPFDGPSWINRILLGQIQVAPELATFLARVDRDMLHLNLKACFAILSHLEAKTMRLTTAAAQPSTMGWMVPASHSNMEDDEDDEKWIAQGFEGYHGSNGNGHHDRYSSNVKANVEDFRVAWKLF